MSAGALWRSVTSHRKTPASRYLIPSNVNQGDVPFPSRGIDFLARAPWRTQFSNTSVVMTCQVLTRDVEVGKNCVKLAPNGKNLRLFKISFSTFWLGEPKCTETDLKKSQICPISGQFDPILMPNLTSKENNCA